MDFRYLTDALTKDKPSNCWIALRYHDCIQKLHAVGYPSYTTSAGWLGYLDEALREKCTDLKNRGWSHFKIKVGRDLNDDLRRCSVLRREMGDDVHMMIDANQVWDVPQAIEWIYTWPCSVPGSLKSRRLRTTSLATAHCSGHCTDSSCHR